MGNGFRPSIHPYDSPTRPWKVEIPASVAGGKRKRKFFAHEDEAKEWVDQFVDRVHFGGVASALNSDSQTVADAMKDFMAAKLENAMERGKDTLILNRDRILEAFGPMPLDAVTPAAVDQWLARKTKKGWSKRTRFNAFSYLRTFMRWCHRRRKIATNPIELLAEEITKPPSPKIIIGPEEMRLLLQFTKDRPILRAVIVFGGYAGIRTEELLKLNWSCCDWEDGEIYVPPGIIKSTEEKGGMRERYVKMIPAFLRHIPRKQTGRIIPVSENKFYRMRKELHPLMREAIKKKKIVTSNTWGDWPDNCLRHSFASALLATSRDAWKVAHELGHTNTKTIHQDYARAMKEKVALAYFNIP